MTDAAVNLIVRANARQLAQELKRSNADLQGFGQQAQVQGRRAQQGLSQAGAAADQVTRQVNAAKAALVGFFSINLAARGVRALAQTADEYANLTAKIRLASNGQADYVTGEAEVFAISQRTSSQLATTATLYSRIYAALKDQGGAQSEVLDLTETINKAFAVSGASAAEQAGAIQQLSQAFASGTLRGDEFNSVNEQAPRLMQALADSLGVSRGALRKMAEEGELTSDKLRQAFSGEQAAKIAEEFDKLPLTIERSFTQLDNAFTRFIGQGDQVSGTSAAIAGSIVGLSNNLDVIAATVEVVAIAFGGRLVAGLVAASAAKVQTAVHTGRLARAELEEARAAEVAARAQVDKARALALGGAGATRLVQAEAALAAAQARTAAATRAAAAAISVKTIAVRALSGALALMGGPIGVVLTGLALLASSFAKAAAEARGLKQDAEAAIEASRQAQGAQDLNALRQAGEGLISRRARLEQQLARQEENRQRATFRTVGFGLDDDGFKKTATFDQEVRETEAALAAVNKELAINTRQTLDLSEAQAAGSRSTRQIAKDSVEFGAELDKQRERSRLATIELEKGYRARLIAEAIAADGVKTEQELSAARIEQIDATAKQRAAEEAASEAKREAAKDQRDAAKADRERAEELKKLTEAQRQFRAETAQLEASNRGELFGAAEQARQQVGSAQREGAAAGLSQPEIQARVAAIMADAQRAVDDAIATGRIELLQAVGETADAATLEASRKYQASIDFFAAQGNEAAANIFRSLFNVDVAKAQLSELDQVYQRTMDDLRSRQESIQTRLQAGLITEAGAQQEIVQLYREKAQIIQGLLPQMEAMARATGDPNALANIQQIRAELERMQATTGLLQQAITNTFEGAFANLLESLIMQTDSLSDAVRNFFYEMALGMARFAAQQLAQAATAKLLSLATGGKTDVGAGAQKLQTAAITTGLAGGAISLGAAQLSAAAKETAAAAATLLAANIAGSASGFADGGYTGPGSKYQVAGVVHAGEYVIRAAQVQRYGLGLFEALNQGRFPFPAIRQVHRPRAGYAEGGLVGGLAPQLQNFLRVYLFNDPDQLVQAVLAHPATEKKMVAVASENGQSITAQW